MKKINPILPAEFTNILRTKANHNKVDYHAYFKPAIETAINYAIGPYFWFIPDNREMKIIATSENIRQLTPYTKEEWIGQGAEFWASNVHPNDANYLMAAATISASIHERNSKGTREKIRINIYCRMLDSEAKYRWTLVQFVARYYNDDDKIESTLVLITDLSLFDMVNKPMMTVINNNNEEHQYFKIISENHNLIPFLLPKISKREQEIVQLMTKGLNSPEIANALNISYHTVENHKRNLRHKTATKTSAELVHYIMANNLL